MKMALRWGAIFAKILQIAIISSAEKIKRSERYGEMDLPG